MFGNNREDAEDNIPSSAYGEYSRKPQAEPKKPGDPCLSNDPVTPVHVGGHGGANMALAAFGRPTRLLSLAFSCSRYLYSVLIPEHILRMA